MKHVQKLICVMLAFLFIMSYYTFTYAVEDTGAVDTETPVSKLQTIGILKGDADGMIHEERQVSRAEFVVMLMRMLQMHDEKAAQPQIRLFSDVPLVHWAAADIEKAYNDKFSNRHPIVAGILAAGRAGTEAFKTDHKSIQSTTRRKTNYPM